MFNQALRRALNVATHDYLVVLITDYAGYDEETRRWVTSIAAHNDVLAVMTYDPLGIRLPQEQGLEVTDGSATLGIPEGDGFQGAFETLFKKRVDEIRGILGSLRIPILPLCTHDPVGDQLRVALGR
ncbi:MAG: hypothetical protein ACQKBU_05705 [Verrucomicrobiales bacterium]